MLEIRPVSAALGAEVAGIDLREPVAEPTYRALRAALVEHQVLFFRDQPIEAAHQQALAELFGPLQTHPAYATVPGHPAVSILESTAEKPSLIEKWHTDMTFRAHPPMGTMLRSRVVPKRGGDTLFASMTATFDALSAPLQALLEGLSAEHSFEHGFRESLAEPGGRERLAQALQENPPVTHPVVRHHPESGRKLLFVNELFTTRIRELTASESEHLLYFLFQHIRSPEFCCRFSWQPDSIAFWDNRSTQHKPVNDYFPAHRRMERITIDGDKPY
ncbi:MAG: taurine dioxygenase [Halieaceae bacterium]|jgi:taurine dioxygenase|nr:taurine dioxygenase [Halieaceae bacterium]